MRHWDYQCDLCLYLWGRWEDLGLLFSGCYYRYHILYKSGGGVREGVSHIEQCGSVNYNPQLHLILSCCVSFKIIYVYVYVLFFHDYDYLVCIFCFEIHSDELCIIWNFPLSASVQVSLSVCLSVCLSVPPSLPLCLSVCLSVCLAFCLCPHILRVDFKTKGQKIV